MSCDGFSTSSVSLKIASVALMATLSLDIAGFALPRWSTLELDINIDGLESFGNIDSDYHVGLWRDCSCAEIAGTSACACRSKVSISGMLRFIQALETLGLIGLIISALITCTILITRQDRTIRTWNIVIVFGSGMLRVVQALETLGLIGLIISTLLTFKILFTKQEKSMRTSNIGVVFGSGLSITAGVIVYAVECNDDYDSLFSFVEELLKEWNLESNPAHLSTSFFLCVIAGALCLLVCTTLLIVDCRTVMQPQQQQMHATEMQNKEQLLSQAPGQITIDNANQETSNMPPTAYAPPEQPATPNTRHDL